MISSATAISQPPLTQSLRVQPHLPPITTSVPPPYVAPPPIIDTRLLKQSDATTSVQPPSTTIYADVDADDADDADIAFAYSSNASDSGLRRSSRPSQPPSFYHQYTDGYTSNHVRKPSGSGDDRDITVVHDDDEDLDDDDVPISDNKLAGNDPGRIAFYTPTVQLNIASTPDSLPTAADLDQQAHLRRVPPHRQQLIAEHMEIDLIYDNITRWRLAYAQLAPDRVGFYYNRDNTAWGPSLLKYFTNPADRNNDLPDQYVAYLRQHASAPYYPHQTNPTAAYGTASVPSSPAGPRTKKSRTSQPADTDHSRASTDAAVSSSSSIPASKRRSTHIAPPADTTAATTTSTTL